MPFIGNGIKSKETGKSGVKTEFTSLFITFHKMVYKIGSGKGSLSTGPIICVNHLHPPTFAYFPQDTILHIQAAHLLPKHLRQIQSRE